MFLLHLTPILICWLLCGIEAFKHSHIRTHPTLLTGNRFEDNLRKRIDPNDERLNRALWAGIPGSPYTLPSTRSSKVITYGIRHRKRAFNPLIAFPNCVTCAGTAEIDGSIDVMRDLNAQAMVNRILPNGRDGQCLFYSQREKDVVPSSLSKSATQLACQWVWTFGSSGEKVRAIWNMWPQDKIQSCKTAGKLRGYDYYCLDAWNPKCCWLNGIFRTATEDTKEAREPLTRPYFQQMSKAMASTCSGTVYIYSDKPTNLLYQPAGQPQSIWLTHELPMLKQLYRNGKVTKLIAIPAVPIGIQQRVTPQLTRSLWEDQTPLLGQLGKRDIEVDESLARHFKELKESRRNLQPVQNDNATHLEERWGTCSNDNAEREPEGADWFG